MYGPKPAKNLRCAAWRINCTTTLKRRRVARRAMATICLLSFGVAADARRAVAMTFDVESFSGGGSGQTALGTSNGIGWTLSPTNIDAGLTITNGSFGGFNSANHVPAVASSDVLHIGGEDFALTFSEPISSIRFYVTENLSPSSVLDFGITPTIVSGDLAVNGTAVSFTSGGGGVFRLDGLDTTVLSHTASIFNSANVAFFAVPEPSTALLAGLGLALLGASRKRAARTRLTRTSAAEA